MLAWHRAVLNAEVACSLSVLSTIFLPATELKTVADDADKEVTWALEEVEHGHQLAVRLCG